jgi:hypothetical protein
MTQPRPGMSTVQLLLFLQGSAFALASVIHSGRVLQATRIWRLATLRL